MSERRLPQMKTYKVTFTPMEPYFFGNEKGFKYPVAKSDMVKTEQNGKSQFTNMYYIKSESLPSQSTLLGALRYHFLPVKKSSWDYDETDKKTNADAVGTESFSPDRDRTFGKIKKISPMFICNDKDILVRVPMNHRNGKTVYTPFENFEMMMTPFGERWYTSEYNAKDGVCSDYMKLSDGSIVDCSEIFETEIRIGINRRVNENGFFKKEYSMLHKGYSFGVYIELEDGLDVNNGIVFLGQGKSAFALEFTEEDNTLTEAVERYLPEGVAYCCGDVFVGPEIYENSKFSVTDTKTYRAYSRQGTRVRKDSVLYRVITAGSIFIPIDKEAFVTSIKKDNLNIIGYNEIIVK